MEFDSNKPIYLQICESIGEQILIGNLKPDDRILSVREYGASIGVNPNTVSRSYEKLMDSGIIYNKRGIGFFVSQNAKDLILEQERKTFMETELPAFLRRMQILGIDPSDVLK